jgi:hypothetical protein
VIRWSLPAVRLILASMDESMTISDPVLWCMHAEDILLLPFLHLTFFLLPNTTIVLANPVTTAQKCPQLLKTSLLALSLVPFPDLADFTLPSSSMCLDGLLLVNLKEILQSHEASSLKLQATKDANK